MKHRFIYWMWGIYVSILVLCVGFIAFVKMGWIGYMPQLDELQNPINRFASQIFSADGKLLGTWSRNENHRCTYTSCLQRAVHSFTSEKPFRSPSFPFLSPRKSVNACGTEIHACGREMKGGKTQLLPRGNCTTDRRPCRAIIRTPTTTHEGNLRVRRRTEGMSHSRKPRAKKKAA